MPENNKLYEFKRDLGWKEMKKAGQECPSGGRTRSLTRHRAIKVPHDGGDAVMKHGFRHQQADHQERFARKIEKITRMDEHRALFEQIEHEIFLGAECRYLDDAVPAALGGKHVARRQRPDDRSLSQPGVSAGPRVGEEGGSDCVVGL